VICGQANEILRKAWAYFAQTEFDHRFKRSSPLSGDHRQAYGGEPICRDLPLAPSTHHEHITRRLDPTRRSARAPRDQELKPEIARMFAAYGLRKVWRPMRLEGALCRPLHRGADDGREGPARGNRR
jgi:putative transposase